MNYQPSGTELQRLVGNPDVYAVQREDGSWTPVRERLTPGVIAKHRRHEITVGTYIVKPPDQARTLVFDIDDKDSAVQQRMLSAIFDVLVQVLPPNSWAAEESGRKGYHVWVLAEDYTDAATLYRLGRGVREEVPGRSRHRGRQRIASLSGRS